MTGVGSPCGACKFLRRKCVNGCIFAPYFSHEQGAMHFAAIHKVFGASNVSKLLTHLPVADRCEAALTISYEARARLQDPIYGCVSHIYALQQQVANLQAQLASLRAQASHGPIINGSGTTTMINGEFPMYPQGVQGLLHIDESNNTISPGLWQSYSANETEVTSYNDSGNLMNNANNVADDFWYTLPHEESDPVFGDPTHGVASLGTQTNSRKWAFQDTHDELKSMAFAYIS